MGYDEKEPESNYDSEGNKLDTFACLYVVRGEPFRPGTCLNLSLQETWIGRTSVEYAPDIAFTNAFISRKHVVIRQEKNKAVLYDLGSRHGTEINGVKVIPDIGYPLQSSDIIKLARGLSVIHFSHLIVDQTLEFESASLSEQLMPQSPEPVNIDWDKRECTVNGIRIIMSDKEYLLIRLLHEYANRMVSIEDIKQAVWAERSLGTVGQPDVHKDELSALIYRIRRKYGKNTFLISAVRGIGYVLETDLNSKRGR
jgi:pSer/pThr/pTyr-binding forkhead associated (FHA) protein